MIESIKIVSTKNNEYNYHILNDFFQLVGINVCEEFNNNYLKEEKYDIVIKSKDNRNYNENDKKTIYMNGISSNKEIENYLKQCLNLIEEKLNINIENLKKIADIYINNNLLYYNNAYKFFFKESKILNEAEDHFVNAYIDLTKIEQNNDCYHLYSKINLAKIINEIDTMLNYRMNFDTEKCLKETDKILELNPKFINTYLLKAMLTEIDFSYQKESIAYYNILLDVAENDYVKSNIYYRRGRNYEKKDINLAKQDYINSIKLSETEYRAIYKLILILKQEKKYIEALENCKKILYILNNRESIDCLQPIEYEYIYKAYLEELNIYRNHIHDHNKYNDTIANINNLLKNIKKQCNKKGSYEQIFGSDSEKFLNLTYKKLYYTNKDIFNKY